MFAPIALFLYNRPYHSERTIQALSENNYAADTDLYVFCDGPKGGSDSDNIKEVHELVDAISGFKSVTVRKADSNNGLGASIIQGVTDVLSMHERVIVLEDDLVTHPDTIAYFNKCLDVYQANTGVFSISGYSYPDDRMKIPDNYGYDVYGIPRMQCWGWATWCDRWDKADWTMADFAEFDSSESLTSAYAHWIGADSLATLRAYMNGKKDVWACRWVYTHFKFHALCICPVRSYIDNIGLDGSGANCGAQSDLKNDLAITRQGIDDLRAPHMAIVDPVIFNSFMNVVNPGYSRNIVVEQHVMPNRTISRIKYWSVRPVQLLKKIYSKICNRSSASPGSESVSTAGNESSVYVAEPKVPLIRLGTEYGGWSVPVNGIGPEDTMISAGAGEDISFDIELAKRCGSRIVIIDPTPRALVHYEETRKLIKAGDAAPINNNPEELYVAEPDIFDNISFSPVGLWDKDTSIRFFPPANDAHVSHSIDNMHETEGGFDAECVTLDTLIENESINDVSILKMDIEGAEYAVIDYMIGHSIRPRYLLVEFHPGKDEHEKLFRTRTNEYVVKLDEYGYSLVQNRGWDYVFEVR